MSVLVLQDIETERKGSKMLPLIKLVRFILFLVLLLIALYWIFKAVRGWDANPYITTGGIKMPLTYYSNFTSYTKLETSIYSRKKDSRGCSVSCNHRLF